MRFYPSKTKMDVVKSASPHHWPYATAMAAAVCFAGILLLGSTGCMTNRQAADRTVTLEGVVTVRGNEPFSAYMLETEEGGLYVLEVPDSLRDNFVTPSRLSVSGRMVEGDRGGGPSPYTHVDVDEWSRLE